MAAAICLSISWSLSNSFWSLRMRALKSVTGEEKEPVS